MKKSKIYRIILAVTVPILLSSCFAAKEYQRPEIINEANFRTDNLPQDTLSIASLSWETLFEDTILQGYIKEGLVNNIDIRVAIQQIAKSEAFFKQGKAGYYPTLEANGNYTRQELSENSQFGGQFSSLDVYELSGNLSWEADIWGKIRSQKRAFSATYLQSVAAHQAVKTELIARIATAYYRLVAMDEQIRITSETVKMRINALETTKALKIAGNVTAVGVKQTEAQVYFAEGLLIDLKRESKLQENSLAILLGKEPSSFDRNKLDGQQIDVIMRTGVPAQLLRNRPDVISAEYQLVNTFELTNVARANFYPSLTLNATGGLTSLTFDQLFSSSSLFATLIGGLTQPIFNGRQIRTQYEVSQAEQEQARLEFRRAVITASKEVSDAYYTYEAATDKIEVKQKEFEAYEIAIDFSEKLLKNGLVNYLEVLTARENALDASLDVIDAKLNQLSSQVELYRALGGGWK